MKNLENWKRAAWLGFAGYGAVMLRYVWTGDDIPAGVVSLVLGVIFGAAGWHGVKRATHKFPSDDNGHVPAPEGAAKAFSDDT